MCRHKWGQWWWLEVETYILFLWEKKNWWESVVACYIMFLWRLVFLTSGYGVLMIVVIISSNMHISCWIIVACYIEDVSFCLCLLKNRLLGKMFGGCGKDERAQHILVDCVVVFGKMCFITSWINLFNGLLGSWREFCALLHVFWMACF